MLSLLHGPACVHVYMTTGKTIALTRRTFVGYRMFISTKAGLFKSVVHGAWDIVDTQ